MRISAAAVGSAVFMIAAPGTVDVLVPWLLTGWRSGEWPIAVRVVGGAVVAIGAVVLVQAFIRFVVDGLGTPAPVAPTEHLVVTGLYRYVRNPMYLAVLAAILGQALLFGRPVLLVYGIVAAACMWSFVRWHEQPALLRRFGDEYRDYRIAVPGWWPRLTSWRASSH